MLSSPSADRLLSMILRHDRKQNSYKLALVRALNDAAVAYPDLVVHGRDVAVPLRVLAASWIAYYWPFADPAVPIYQGQRRRLSSGGRANDVEFRPPLTSLRMAWSHVVESAQSADGFLLAGDMAVARRRASYPVQVIRAFDVAVRATMPALAQPIRYAGPGEWQVFPPPRPWRELQGSGVISVPGTAPSEVCVIVRADIWRVLVEHSLWIEALAIHQWALFTESVDQGTGHSVPRGDAYTLLTDRPGNRRPLTWERNRVDLLLLEGRVFTCPWTGRRLDRPGAYDLDHLVPLAVYPMNDLWNLVPADTAFNSHTKRDRLPTEETLVAAIPRLVAAYRNYETAADLAPALQHDALGRFSTLHEADVADPEHLADVVASFIRQVAETRSVERFRGRAA